MKMTSISGERCDQYNDFAVQMSNVNVKYRSKVNILQNLTLKIPKGQIFALLGANGVGKTTAIRVILGRVKLDSGSVQVFGHRPGCYDSDVPGIGVGYMPQELALFEYFTINEILTYYAMIYHMKSEETKQRIQELKNLLNLPEINRFVIHLSGGEKRRVSIAVSIIHRPKLIILDEPTVGVDPIMRYEIWNYLKNICFKNGQTVIITTHYVEEAKSAANVAFMTNGSVLRQENPQKLLQEYNTQSLEEVFLILCQQKCEEKQIQNELSSSKCNNNLCCNDTSKNILGQLNSLKSIRIKAMLWKYFTVTYRRPLYLVIYCFLPLISFSALHHAIDQYPSNTPIAVVNYDINSRHSHNFIKSIDNQYLKVNEYADNKTAFESVVKGYNYISLFIPENYSESFELRLNNMYDMTDEELVDSEIKLYVDFSNTAITMFSMIEIFNAFEKMSKELINENNFFENSLSFITIKDTVFGSFEFKFTNLLLPGLMVTLVITLTMLSSASHLLKDQSTERVFVSGVKPLEYYLAHMLQTQLSILLLVSITMVTCFVLLDNTQLGRYWDVFLILFLEGLFGTLFGLMATLLLCEQSSTNMTIIGVSIALFFTSGIIWPIEAIPNYLRVISDYNPMNKPVIALRSVMYRGWSYSNPAVLDGYIIIITYIFFANIINIFLFQKYSNKKI